MSFDLRMDDLIKFFELSMVGKHDAAQRGAIEMTVGGANGVPPSFDDLVERRRPELHGATRENIGVDDRGAALGQQLRDGRLATSDVSRESYEKHDGFLGCTEGRPGRRGQATGMGTTRQRFHGGDWT